MHDPQNQAGPNGTRRDTLDSDHTMGAHAGRLRQIRSITTTAQGTDEPLTDTHPSATEKSVTGGYAVRVARTEEQS